MAPRGLALILTSVIAVLGAGCSDEEGEEESGSELSALVDRLPRGEFPGVAVVDVVAAREALGVAEDIDPRTAILEGDPESRFGYAVAIGIPYLQDPQETPLVEAIDATQITAAASTLTFGEGAVTVLQTDQDFEEIASSLEGDGFTRDGDLLTSDAPPLETGGASAVAGGDGLVALGFAAEDASAAVGEISEVPEGPERDLIADLDAPAAVAIATPEGSDTCYEAIAIVDRLVDGEGEFVVVAAEPSADGFVFNDGADEFLSEPYDFGEPTIDGTNLRVPFTYPIDQPGGPEGLLFGDIPAGTIYDCEEVG